LMAETDIRSRKGCEMSLSILGRGSIRCVPVDRTRRRAGLPAVGDSSVTTLRCWATRTTKPSAGRGFSDDHDTWGRRFRLTAAAIGDGNGRSHGEALLP
jgi:hypothetical protein